MGEPTRSVGLNASAGRDQRDARRLHITERQGRGRGRRRGEPVGRWLASARCHWHVLQRQAAGWRAGHDQGLLRDVPRDALRCGHRVRGDARLAIGRVHHLTVQGRAQDEFCAVVDRRPRLCHLHGRARLRRVARAVIHQPAGARADAQVRLSERFAAGGHEAAVHVSRLEAAYGDGGVAVGAHAVVDELLGDRVWLGALGVRDHARVPRVRDAHLPAQV
mmetsp:Transcript_2401/g.6434  ORF Transcript_2401/g.6434 Transcript_2401/m.6434 type:complete len:220 (+) Transcript_2401:336-995(+)